jgi:predicted O-methyltransferase YrrM
MPELQMINPLVEQYAHNFTSPEDEVLQKIARDTVVTHPQAHMLSGHVQGRILTFISTILQPKYVLEIGTFTGYSALCLVEGLAPDGELHTIELREEEAKVAEENFLNAKKNKRITLHHGNAVEIIPQLPHFWDLVFIDADKPGYINYYEMIVPRLSDRGIILADNVLFHGQVLQQPVKGKNAEAIEAFNKHVANDTRVTQVLLTVRDGLLMIKKK